MWISNTEDMDRIPIEPILDELNGRPVSEEDALRLKEWLSVPGNTNKYESVRSLWTDTRRIADMDFDKFSARRRLKAQMVSSRRPVPAVFKVALASAIVVIAVLIPTLTGRHVTEAPSEPVLSEVSVPMGSHTRFRLPDGTIVVLNAGSVLTYSSDFGLSDRNVRLDGEGYFEVVKNPELPFVVSAKACEFEVLGTKFNITAYAEEGLTAALMEGSLKMSSGSDSEIMSPGEIATVDPLTAGVIKWKGDVSQYNSWVNGFLRFDSISLSDLVARLSREYNVDIVLEADDIRERTLRISFNLNEPVGDILESLSSIIPVRLVYDNGKYYINDK